MRTITVSSIRSLPMPELLYRPESACVLGECSEIQIKKASDYQNRHSTVRQADYYPSGVMTIIEIMHGKMLRLRSVAEAMRDDPDYSPNFEALEDSCKDLANYSSFAVAYLRGKMDGQDPNRDLFNRPRTTLDGHDVISVAKYDTSATGVRGPARGKKIRSRQNGDKSS